MSVHEVVSLHRDAVLHNIEFGCAGEQRRRSPPKRYEPEARSPPVSPSPSPPQHRIVRVYCSMDPVDARYQAALGLAMLSDRPLLSSM